MDDASFSLAISIAEEDGKRAQSDAWVAAQVSSAERLFGPIGVHVHWTLEKPLGARFARIETRRDRDALGTELEGKSINVMVVSLLRDVDDPTRERMGVCWQNQSDTNLRYLIVSATAKPTVLAHELGHFFGNPHSPAEDNVMSYARTGAAIFFDGVQQAVIRAKARSYLSAGILLPAPLMRMWP